MNQIAEEFPREDFVALVRRIPAYARLAWSLARDPRLSKARRAAVLAAAAYVLSPIDLVPGLLPVVGQIDDLLIALGAIRVALNGLKPAFRHHHLAAAGLSQAELDEDLRTTTRITAWLARSGARVGVRAASAAAKAGVQFGRHVFRAARDLRSGRYRVPAQKEDGRG